MGRFHCPVFSKKTIYVDFKAQRNVLYRCHGNVILDENVMWEIYDGCFCLDMIILTVSKTVYFEPP